MKRADIKRRPMADSTLAGLEPEDKTYREHDGQGLYFRVKPSGQKLWELRYSKPGSKDRTWLGLGQHAADGSFAASRALALAALRPAFRQRPMSASVGPLSWKLGPGFEAGGRILGEGQGVPPYLARTWRCFRPARPLRPMRNLALRTPAARPSLRSNGSEGVV